MLNKLENVLFHTGVIRNKIYWKISKSKLRKIGEKSSIGVGFSIIGHEYIEIGDNFSGGTNIRIHAWNKGKTLPVISIGNDVTITDNCYISCLNEIIIGNGVLFGVNSFITDNQHGESSIEDMMIPPNKRNVVSKGKVVIGDNVWIGRNVCIMPNVTIGEGTIIGANAVVTHDIPPFCVAAGVPAKVIQENRKIENSK